MHVVDDGAGGGGGGGHVMPTMNCAHIQQAKVNAAATADESTFFFLILCSISRTSPRFLISYKQIIILPILLVSVLFHRKLA
jgi:hypothetical protein